MSLERTGRTGGVRNGYVPLYPDMRHALLMCHLGISMVTEPPPMIPQWNFDDSMSQPTQQNLPAEPRGDCDDDPFAECGKFIHIVIKVEIHPLYCSSLLTRDLLRWRDFEAAPHWMMTCDILLKHSFMRFSFAAARLSVKTVSTETADAIQAALVKAAKQEGHMERKAHTDRLISRNRDIYKLIAELRSEVARNAKDLCSLNAAPRLDTK